MLNIVDYEVIILLTLSNIFLASAFAFFIARNKLKNVLFGWLNDYIEQIVAEMREKPDLLVSILSPVMKKMMAQYGVSEGGKQGTMNLFGMKIPAALIEAFLPKVLGKAAAKNPFE